MLNVQLDCNKAEPLFYTFEGPSKNGAKMQENVNCGNGLECVMTLGKLKGPQKCCKWQENVKAGLYCI
jgi:hypothetical protein